MIPTRIFSLAACALPMKTFGAANPAAAAAVVPRNDRLVMEMDFISACLPYPSLVLESQPFSQR